MQHDHEFMKTDGTENPIKTAVEAGRLIGEIKQIPRDEEKHETHFLVPEGFQLESINNELNNPLRKTGDRVFHAAGSFCSYVNKHKTDGDTIIIADEDNARIKAFLNDHGEKPNWQDFTATLELGFSKQWNTWFKHSAATKHTFTQEEFADFLEDNRTDFMTGEIKTGDDQEVKSLSALELSAVISNLQMTVEEKLVSNRDNVTGRIKFSYENNEKKGSVEIPKVFFLAIPIYRCGDTFQVTIRLRYRSYGGKVTFYYIIDELEALKELAFDKVCNRIKTGNAGSESCADKQFQGTGLELLKGQL